jgi:membrane-associated phospholipid phosphatase
VTDAVVAVGRRYLPRGWSDFGLQLAIWFGFLAVYQVARGIADRDATDAFVNGYAVIDIEQRVNALFEVSLQGFVEGSGLLVAATSYTYWLSQFAVLGVALLWVYLRRYHGFIRLRNTILLANVIGLVGFVLLPTAPPRMFWEFGFSDTLASFGSLNHGSGLIQLASNPYAAMPSLHAADALIVGVVLAVLSRHWWAKALWLLWPAWVWFSVMGTGNHFWLDIVAGIGVAVVALFVVYRRSLRRLVPAA